MKKDQYTIVLIVVIIGIVVLGYYGLKQFGLLAISETERAQLLSPTNMLKNPEMEVFCVRDDAQNKWFTDDGTNTVCTWSHFTAWDVDSPLGIRKFPYDWTYSYGSGLYQYSGTEPAYVGSKMILLEKTTTRDWYGFGIDNIPVTAGKAYEAYMYVNRLSKSGDSRDCGFRIDFKNSAGQDLTNTENNFPGSLDVGANGWARAYTLNVAPVGASTAGIYMWCPQFGIYQYLIDGQYFGETEICSPGTTRACGDFDVGACRKGTQTCNSDGIWGVCNGNVDPIQEVCGNGRDDNCNGILDDDETLCEGTIIVPPETPDYTPYFIVAIASLVLIIGVMLIKKK